MKILLKVKVLVVYWRVCMIEISEFSLSIFISKINYQVPIGSSEILSGLILQTTLTLEFLEFYLQNCSLLLWGGY